LQKATHPSLDKRFSQALTAKEILNQSPEMDGLPLALSSSEKSLIRKQKNWNFIWRNTAMGTLVGSFSGIFFGIEQLYKPSYYDYNKNMGLLMIEIVATEVIIGFFLGLISGAISAFASNYLSTKDKYYSHQLGLIISGGSMVSLALLSFLNHLRFDIEAYRSLEGLVGSTLAGVAFEILGNFLRIIPQSPSFDLFKYGWIPLFYVAIPILSFALTMGWISYSGACWYQKQLISLPSKVSPKANMDKKLVFWNFILRSTAMGTLVGVFVGLTASYILNIFDTDFYSYNLLDDALVFISGAGSGSMVGFILGLTNGITAAVNTLSSSNHGKRYPLKSGLIGTAVGLVGTALISMIGSRNNMEVIIPISSIALILGVISSSNARWYQKQIEE
jgi:MFS family permease